MRIPHFAGQTAYAYGNPPVNTQTSTHNVVEDAQPTMSMPNFAAHQTAMACSMQSACTYEGMKAATFGYMEPQYA